MEIIRDKKHPLLKEFEYRFLEGQSLADIDDSEAQMVMSIGEAKHIFEWCMDQRNKVIEDCAKIIETRLNLIVIAGKPLRPLDIPFDESVTQKNVYQFINLLGPDRAKRIRKLKVKTTKNNIINNTVDHAIYNIKLLENRKLKPNYKRIYRELRSIYEKFDKSDFGIRDMEED